MCFRRPTPPPPPDPEPVDSPIEATAETVTVGKKRPSKKKKQTGDKIAMGRKLGTRSLQIPLLDNNKGGDLNYPT